MAANEPQSDRDYQAIVETIPAIVFIADTGEHGAWRYVNDWIEPILGFTVEEWTADPTLWARQLHPEDRAEALAAEQKGVAELTAGLREGPREQWGSFLIDYRMLHKDGHVVWIRDSSMLVRSPDGTPLWHGVLMDISDQKQIEQELERRSAAQAAVARLGEHALAGTPIQELLDEACRTATEVLGIEAAAANQIRDERGALELRAEYGWHTPADLRNRDRFDPDSPSSYMLQSGKPLLVADWELETRFSRTDRVAEQGIRSSIGVRIEGPVSPWGIFRVFSTRPNVFSDSDVNFVVSIANVLADAIERQQAEDAMQHRALHDPLTSLPNRVLFTDRVEQALERVRRHPRSLAAILFIDVDHFKQVNDTLGHQAGDDLLVGVAARLREAVRPTDTVARFGGDEFGLLLEEVGSERDAIATAERIAAGFAKPFVLDSGSQFVTASIGIALADGHEDPQALLRDADAAMYRAKQRGRARYDLFDEDLRARALARGRIENDLRRALDFSELRLVYQPVVKLRDELMDGVEALLRWEHPQRGAMSPSEFIPVAEESGLIDRIGQWVIETALRDASRWAQALPDRPPLRLGLNISNYQLQNLRFPEQLAEAIQLSALDPACVYLELDESVLRDEAEQIRRSLPALKRIGVHLLIQDFGAGEASLTQLAALPIDAIKVGRQFVAELGSDGDAGRIARAVIATGSALGLDVIGAGAETNEQVEELRRLNGFGVQGFLFSPPVSAAEITDLLADDAGLKRTLA
jgi:diguanylate cyclase (GGDEF)-like protein/PAS domain S-box-containing protein